MKTQTRTQPDPDFLPSTWPGGYFHAPQAIRDLLARERISGMIQAQILLEINGEMGRQGENGKPAAWATGLTVPKLAKACNRDPKEQLSGVEKALADLLKRGLISREATGKTWINGGKVQCKNWKYRIDPAAWKAAPKYEPPVEEDEDEAEEDEAAQADVQAKTWPADMLMSMPGRGSKPFTLGEAAKRVRIVANETEMPVAFRFRTGENGDLEIRIEKAETASEVPSAKVPRTQDVFIDSKGVTPNTSVLADGSLGAKEGPKEEPETSVLQEGSPASLPDSPPPPDALEEYILREVAPLTGNVVSEEILSKVRSNLNGTPLDYLKDRVRARAKKYTSHEFLPHLAQDARERYQKEKRLGIGQPSPSQGLDAPFVPSGYGSFEEARVNWDKTPEDWRDFYRKAFPEETAKLDGGVA